MTYVFKIALFLISLALLNGCAFGRTDCNSLTNDRAGYRLCNANQGSEISQYELGVAAYDAKDYKTALKWLKRAANPRQEQNYSDLFSNDNNKYPKVIPENNLRIRPGHSGAQSLLARMYKNGIGVEVDLERAQYYQQLYKK